jgi:hypothetical protein
LSIAARQFHALAIMGLGLFEVGEWPCNRNNGVRTFDVGPCSDGGAPLPVKPTAKMKDGIRPNHPSRLELWFCHCLMPLHVSNYLIDMSCVAMRSTHRGAEKQLVGLM